jgi:general stress protein 26
MKNLTKKQAECLKIMETATIVYLTNIDKNGFPSTRAMLNLRNPKENPLTVFMTTNTL